MGKATLVLEIDGRSDGGVRDILLTVAKTLDSLARETGLPLKRIYVETPKEPRR